MQANNGPNIQIIIVEFISENIKDTIRIQQGENIEDLKYRDIGIRVVYVLVPEQKIMNIIVISEHDDDYCYAFAAKLYKKCGDDVFEEIFKTI